MLEAAVGICMLPALAIVRAPVHASLLQAGVAVAITAAAAFAAGFLPRTRILAFTGATIACMAAWLLSEVSYPVAAWIVAPSLGVAIGLVTLDRPFRFTTLSFVASAVTIALTALLRFTVSRDAAMLAAAVLMLAAASASVAAPGRSRARLRDVAVALGALLLSLGTAGYIGATTPTATWAGSLTSHGPRDSNQVAITFDDGPDPPYTLQIRDILDAHGVKATFFTVGKALDARPDVSKALLDDGQLLGDHSYHHDAFSWLDPRYPELQETQDAFRRNLGVCPSFYRPPHGTHTPFIAHEVSNRDMRMITWDVSAGDWATDDASLVAKRVLDKVRPGSIILLHDGIDGNIGADRSVILAALPRILDGLAQRGLKPVTLDKLLGTPGYLPSC